MKKTIHIIISLIILIIVILNVYILYVKIIKKEDMVFIGKYGSAVVLSGSMEPNLSINDLIIIRKETNYNVNDIVVYSVNNALVVHRIIDLQTNQIITKGDANNKEDVPIDKNIIKGRVVHKYSKIGKILLEFNNPLYISSFIMLYLLYEIVLKRHA